MCIGPDLVDPLGDVGRSPDYYSKDGKCLFGYTDDRCTQPWRSATRQICLRGELIPNGPPYLVTDYCVGPAPKTKIGVRYTEDYARCDPTVFEETVDCKTVCGERNDVSCKDLAAQCGPPGTRAGWCDCQGGPR